MATLPHEEKLLEYERALAELRRYREGLELLSPREVGKLEKKLDRLKEKVYAKLSPVERLQICRHPKRPQVSDYIQAMCEEYLPLHGDRCFGDDSALVGGFARIEGRKFIVIGQEKGADTQSRLRCNFGMCHPEGFRKAMRLMKLASRFHLPVLSLVDTKGAYPGLTAEERGQAWAIAENLREMSLLPTPFIVVVIGEAASGGALAIAMGDRVGMLEHSYYSVISPEGCASILWRDAEKKAEAAAQLKLNAENMVDLGVVDTLIREPLGGAHHAPPEAYQAVQQFVLASWEELKRIPLERLLEERYQRYRKIGLCEDEV